jgi:hypothetical protein
VGTDARIAKIKKKSVEVKGYMKQGKKINVGTV